MYVRISEPDRTYDEHNVYDFCVFVEMHDAAPTLSKSYHSFLADNLANHGGIDVKWHLGNRVCEVDDVKVL